MSNSPDFQPRPLRDGSTTSRASAGGLIDIQKIISIVRRRLKLLLAIGLVVFLAVLVFTITRTPVFTASTTLIIDSRQENVVDSQAVLTGLSTDTSVIDSEVQILSSRKLAGDVVKALNLAQDPEFNGRLREPGLAGSVINAVKGVFGAARPDAPAPLAGTDAANDADAHVVGAVLSRTAVQRVGLTNVLSLSFTSESPSKAARIANAFASQYLQQQLEAKFDATSGANTFLDGRLEELGAQMNQAEAAVAQYRAANGLLSAGGTTLTEQEISAYNQQLATARATLAEEEARLRTARAQLARGSDGDDVGEALNSEVVQALRASRAAVSGRVADLSSRYGPRHPDLLRAQRELGDIDGQIQAEIQRIISNLEARVSVARERAQSVAGSLGSARGTLASNSAASVRLNELERNAESARTLYQSFLDRSKETSAQQGIEQADARIVSPASTPTRQSSPKVLLNLVLGLILAGGAGLGAVILAELMDTGLAVADDVERKLGLAHIGAIPLLGSVTTGRERSIEPVDYVLLKPLSAFAEAFRSLRASITAPNGGVAQIVALTSALPDEGKTTTAISLARVSAQAGSKVLLIDGDLRRRAVTRMLGLSPVKGIIDVVLGEATFDDVVVKDKSGAYILPTTPEGAKRDVLGTPAMADLLKAARGRFDLIIIDTPPVLAVADARTLAAESDATVLLVRWRKTPARAVESALRLLDQSSVPVAGVALTRVDMNAQSRHGYGDAAYYYGEYKKYYTA